MARHRIALDPVELARWQRDLDRTLTRRNPTLFEQKRAKMLVSPHAFLRGTAAMFHRVAALRPDLFEGPEGEGWVVGDLHVENFGAYRVEGPGRERVVFDLNDLDLAAIGPWRFDLTRLATSLLLAARDLGHDGATTADVALAALRSWRDTLFGERPLPAAPAHVRRRVATVGRRTRHAMLADRTEASGGKHRFKRGERYRDLDQAQARKVERAFARYLASLPEEHRPDEEEGAVEDLAFRVAGTGSLGVLRVAVLTRGRGGPDGRWIFDLKETLDPPGGEGFRVPDVEPAERVVQAMRACLDGVPRMLGTARVGDRSLLARRLAPQEDKLELGEVSPRHLADVARYLGALVARAHLRGADRVPSRAWDDGSLRALLARSSELAGVHLATWLAWCADP